MNCQRCNRPTKAFRIGCKFDDCPYRLIGGRNSPIPAINPHLEAIYKTRVKIDDTISTPDDYMEICKRIDDFACDQNEPTFDEWRKKNDGG